MLDPSAADAAADALHTGRAPRTAAVGNGGNSSSPHCAALPPEPRDAAEAPPPITSPRNSAIETPRALDAFGLWSCGAAHCVAVVTGGTGAIGGAIINGLAAKGARHLVTTVRPGAAGAARASAFARAFRARWPSSRLDLITADLSSPSDLDLLCGALNRLPVRVLVNNAAAAPRDRRQAADGVEMQVTPERIPSPKSLAKTAHNAGATSF